MRKITGAELAAKLIVLDDKIAALHDQLFAAKTPAARYRLENQIARLHANRGKLIAAQYV